MNINNDIFNDNDTEMLDAELDEDEDEEDEELTQQQSQQLLSQQDEDEDDDDEDEEDDDEDEDDDDDDDDDDDEEEEEENEDSANKKEDEEVVKEDTKEESDTKEATLRQQLLSNARLATGFDIVPYVAIPYGTLCHSIALSRGPKWLFTGGEDGFIRKYDFISSIEGNLQLTVAQKHSLVDTMSLAGIINSYWENEQPIYKEDVSTTTSLATTLGKKTALKRKNEDSVSSTHYEPKLSPVYSMAVEKNSFWLLSGLESGGITLQSVRHGEGQIRHYFAHGDKLTQHNSAVDVLQLNNDNDKFLSGGWDRKILQWDLNTGDVVKSFQNSTSQVSSLQYRPVGGIEINAENYQRVNEEDEDMDSLFEESDNEQTKIEITKQQQQQQVTEKILDDNIFMSSSMDGAISIWDLRIQDSQVLRIPVPPSTPPWCMSACWSNDGNFVYAGRRNSTVEEISIKMPYTRHTGQSLLSKVLKFPTVSGPVSVVKPMLNDHHLLCGSYDNIRMYDLRLYDDLKKNPKKLKIPFMIIPGHHGGVLSDLYVDPTCRFMVSASGNRGWNGSSTEMVLIYEINVERSKKTI